MVDEKKDGKPTIWNKRKMPERFDRVEASGIYNFIVKEAWDSKFAPVGTGDANRGMEARYIGISAAVVSGIDGVKTNQEGRYIRMWCNLATKKDQDNMLIAFDAMNIIMDPNDIIEPDSGLSISEFVGQYFKAKVTMRPDKNDSEKVYANVAVWEMWPPDGKIFNNEHTLSIDDVNDISVKHYTDELARIAKRKDSAVPDIEDDELPF